MGKYKFCVSTQFQVWKLKIVAMERTEFKVFCNYYNVPHGVETAGRHDVILP